MYIGIYITYILHVWLWYIIKILLYTICRLIAHPTGYSELPCLLSHHFLSLSLFLSRGARISTINHISSCASSTTGYARNICYSRCICSPDDIGSFGHTHFTSLIYYIILCHYLLCYVFHLNSTHAETP